MDLPKHPVVHGHPIHAILSDGPVVLIPLAVAAELLDRSGRGRELRLGDAATAAAAATASAAGMVGWIDWLTIPPDHPARRPATIHGIINTGAILAVTAALPARRQRLQLHGGRCDGDPRRRLDRRGPRRSAMAGGCGRRRRRRSPSSACRTRPALPRLRAPAERSPTSSAERRSCHRSRDQPFRPIRSSRSWTRCRSRHGA